MDTITRRNHAGVVAICNHGLTSWRSKLQSIVTLSSAEAEYVALAEMICEVKYSRELARGLGFEQTEPTLIYEDNRAAILTAEAECSTEGRLKHVDVKYRFATEAVRKRVVRVRYNPTNMNLSHIMTKALVPKKHKEGVDLIINAKDAYRIVRARREMADENTKLRTSSYSKMVTQMVFIRGQGTQCKFWSTLQVGVITEGRRRRR